MNSQETRHQGTQCTIFPSLSRCHLLQRSENMLHHASSSFNAACLVFCESSLTIAFRQADLITTGKPLMLYSLNRQHASMASKRIEGLRISLCTTFAFMIKDSTQIRNDLVSKSRLMVSLFRAKLGILLSTRSVSCEADMTSATW